MMYNDAPCGPHICHDYDMSCYKLCYNVIMSCCAIMFLIWIIYDA